MGTLALSNSLNPSERKTFAQKKSSSFEKSHFSVGYRKNSTRSFIYDDI